MIGEVERLHSGCCWLPLLKKLGLRQVSDMLIKPSLPCTAVHTILHG